ncbi:hypothetical protein [Roseimaritima ulvae]|nr:hypothetical protein [Roseimaritima ulvae]
MKRIAKQLAASTLALGMALPASAQIVDVEAGGTRVQVGGGAGVQVDTPDTAVQTEADVRVEGRRGSSRLSSKAMVDWLLTDQQSIQQLAQFGLTRSKAPEVRQLAEMVARDHAALAQRLQQLSTDRTQGEVDVDVSGQAVERAEANAERRQAIRDRREEARHAAREQREQIGDARRAADGVVRPIERLADRVEDGVERVAEGAQNAAEATREAIDANLGDDRVARRPRADRMHPQAAAVQLHRQIVAQTARIARSDLERRDGYEFNAAFVGMLEAAHLQQQATLEVMTQHADGELHAVLEDALTTIKQHRQSAGQVMQNLKP